MTERVRHVRHPIARRYPAEPPPRIEMQIRRGAYDVREDMYPYSDQVCDCFPRTSKHTIPSMFYDKIVCPHTHKAHIQPAQEHQFNYPWTTESLGRRQRDYDELSERLSLISEEDDQLRFSPRRHLVSREPDEVSVNTAPPFMYNRGVYPRTDHPPYTAPVNNMDIVTGTRKATSMKDVRDPGFRLDDADIQGRRNVSRAGQQQSRLSNRQFTGSYVDPKSGKVYKYNVNYDGTPNPAASRMRAQKPTGKPMTAT